MLAYVRERVGMHGLAVFGCFDISHPGHDQHLREARRYGGFVLVCVESDETIALNKGPGRPVNTQLDRMHMMAANTNVGAVVGLQGTISYDDAAAHIQRYRNVGWDIAVPYNDPYYDLKMRQALDANIGAIPIYMPLTPHSTTSIIERIARG